MMKKFFLILLTMPFTQLMGMDSWPKDKPVPFNALPIEYISSDDESEPQQPREQETIDQESKNIPHEPAAAAPAPWWAKGREPSQEMIAKYEQRAKEWGYDLDPLPEIVAKHAQRSDKPYTPPAGSVIWRFFSGHGATAQYDDTQKSYLVQQLLFKHLCVQAWDRLNPLMDHEGAKAWHDFMVKFKRNEIHTAQTEVAITKKDLYHRLLPLVLTNGTQCRVNNKDMVLVFKPATQNGIEGERVSTEYDLQADKAGHEQVMETFAHILDISSRMNETWVANPNQ